MRSAVSRCVLNNEKSFVIMMFSGEQEVEEGNCFCELVLCETKCSYSDRKFHFYQSFHDVLKVERVEAAVVVGVAGVAVIDCEFSWIFSNSCALCLFHCLLRPPCSRCCLPSDEQLPLPFSWRMTCGVMAEDLTPGCAVEQLLQA